MMRTFQKIGLLMVASALAFSTGVPAQPVIGDQLVEAWRRLPEDAALPVVISLKSERDDTSLPTHFGRTVAVNGQVVGHSVDGQPITDDEFNVFQEEFRQRLAAVAEGRQTRLRANWRELVRRMGWIEEDAGDRISGNRVNRRLTRHEIEALVENAGDLISSITLPVPEYDEMASALVSIGITDWALPYGHDGTGIGMYMREAEGKKCPDSSNAYFDASRYTLIDGTPKIRSGHATRVGVILQQGATDAYLYCSGEYFVANPGSYDPPIYVSNHSWGASTGKRYSTYERDFDDDIYNNRMVTFKSVGNGGNVTSPGKAYNIIAVGGYDDVDDSLYNHSYANPETGAEKPEVVAPAVCLDIASWSCRTGTSYSSPFTATLTADLMESLTQLRNRPELVKATLMAGAIRNIEGDARLSDKDGAGGIDFKTTYDSTVYRWWDGQNGEFFDANGEIAFTESLVAGTRYRMAIVWLIPGTYAYANSPQGLTMDLDLDVSYGGSSVTSSTSAANAFEIVDFVAASTGSHDVTIKRVWNSGEGRVILGFNLAPVP